MLIVLKIHKNKVQPSAPFPTYDSGTARKMPLQVLLVRWLAPLDAHSSRSQRPCMCRTGSEPAWGSLRHVAERGLEGSIWYQDVCSGSLVSVHQITACSAMVFSPNQHPWEPMLLRRNLSRHPTHKHTILLPDFGGLLALTPQQPVQHHRRVLHSWTLQATPKTLFPRSQAGAEPTCLCHLPVVPDS